VRFAAENVINGGQSTKEMTNILSTVRSLLEHGANVNVIMPDGLSPLSLIALNALADGQRSEYRTCIIELLQLMVKYGAELHDYGQLGDNDYLEILDNFTLPALCTYDGEDYIIVELFRAGAGFPLLAYSCYAVARCHWEAKSICLCQAAVLAGYVPSDEDLQRLQSLAAHDDESGHQIQQLVNWLNEDRRQVPSLLRQCRVVIRRQLSAAVHFKSILPAIDKLPLPTALKLYLQFDGLLSEVDFIDLDACLPSVKKTSVIGVAAL